MLQAFEWNVPPEGRHYNFLREQIPHLAQAGITALWLPPAAKATSIWDTGYGSYDLYDLGEFDQKGDIRTKYGTKDELLQLIETAHQHGLQVYADVVLNHKAQADEEETFQAVEVDPDNRSHELGEPRDIRAWTKFTFPGRAGQYSDFQWNFNHFTGVDYDSLSGQSGIYKILGENKDWSDNVSGEKGNFDYLMFADINLAHPDVRAEIFAWAKWFIETTGVNGFRFDALKHMDHQFVFDLMQHIRSFAPDFYFVGELWQPGLGEKESYLAATDYQTDLFDVGLHYNLFAAAKGPYDLRQIFSGSLVEHHPELAVTFVDNHDTQPGQGLTSFVDPWFKKIAYSLILLRAEGYPCVFFGDFYGLGEPEPMSGLGDVITNLIYIRQHYAFGEQVDYFESDSLIGWTRLGNQDHPGRLAVVISSGDMATLRMHVGQDQAGKVYHDLTGANPHQVVIDDEGWGAFEVGPGDVSCWAEQMDG